MAFNPDKFANDPAYRELYLKYLGTLRVLGDSAAHVKDHWAQRESIDACMEDAATFLKGRVRIRRVMQSYDVTAVSSDDAEDEVAPADDAVAANDPRAL
jgi:hypothetical protein